MSSILALIVGSTLIRLVFAASVGLGIDESYMVTAGRTLSLGYFDHPPVSWWISWGAAHLFQTEAPWAVRLPFVLLFAVSQILVWRITLLVANQRSAFWAVLAINLSPVFGVTSGAWVLPDGPLDTALLGAAFCLLKAVEDRGWGWWIVTGITAGLALFSKYSTLSTILGAFLFLCVDRAGRRWLIRPQPYVAMLVALAMFSPVLVWNATHHWASLAFQGDRATGFRFRPWMPLQVLGGEALFVLPWFWLPMMLLLGRGLFRTGDWRERLLGWLAVPPIALFALISIWSGQRILFHWAAPGYLMLFPVLGQAIARHIGSVHVRRMIVATATSLLVAVGMVSTDMQFDWLGTSLSRLGRDDPTAEGVDWSSIRDELQAKDLLKGGTIAAAFSWRDAGKIGRGLGPDVPILCLSTDARQLGIATPFADYAARDVLILSPDSMERSEELGQKWFSSVEPIGTVPVTFQGRVLRTLTILRGHRLMAAPTS